MSKKIAYVAMRADFIHAGHLNVIEKARELGDVVVGLLTDEAISQYRRLPFLDYAQRESITRNIKGVVRVIPQRSLCYKENLNLLKPDFVVHGDNWKAGFQSSIRADVIKMLEQWGGELVEIPYTEGISSTTVSSAKKELGVTPGVRLRMLRRLLNSKKTVRIMEAHNGLTGLIVENTGIEQNGVVREFDGIWLSSLTESTAKGKPDIELVDLTARMRDANDIAEVTTKPIIYDGDTGGVPEHFVFMVRTLERLGISAVIIEDKVGLKKNSLFGTEAEQQQDSIENFCYKITCGKKAQVTKEFMVIARVESLILNQGMEDALQRAKAYTEAGADAIMIHSKSRDGKEVLDFCDQYRRYNMAVPIVVVPSTYSYITEDELADAGASVVIYANHMIRAAYPAMVDVAKKILVNGRAHDVEDKCMPIKEIISLVPVGEF